MSGAKPPSPSDIELLSHPHQQRELRFWADIRLGGYVPGPEFVVPAWNSAARYVTPKDNDQDTPEKEPLPPLRITPVLHDPKWVVAKRNTKLNGSFGKGWYPVKRLADGGFGSISIWEFRGAAGAGAGTSGYGLGYVDDDDNDEGVPRKRIVVKNGEVESLIDKSLLLEKSASNEPTDFGLEARILWVLRRAAASQHIVRIEWPPQNTLLPAPPTLPFNTNTPGADNDNNKEKDDDADDRTVKEIYMEFCEGGDLEMEIWKRFEEKKPFWESEIWWLADCLVKALSVLECGSEDGRGRRDWCPIVHFDLKPSNVLRGDYDGEKMMRVYKLADFGNAQFMPIGPVSLKKKIELRRKATRGFYTPEQFTERWNYKGWESNEISGEYSTKTNIYGLGLILWSAVTLLRHPIPAHGYTSKLAGSKKGLTYGKSIEKMPEYSSKLKKMILSCLFERPENRPSLRELRKLVGGADVMSDASQRRRGGRFDFVIDLSKGRLEWEAGERKRMDEERAREERRREREEKERVEREKMLEVERREEAKAFADEDADDWDIDFGEDDEDSGEDMEFESEDEDGEAMDVDG